MFYSFDPPCLASGAGPSVTPVHHLLASLLARVLTILKTGRNHIHNVLGSSKLLRAFCLVTHFKFVTTRLGAPLPWFTGFFTSQPDGYFPRILIWATLLLLSLMIRAFTAFMLEPLPSPGHTLQIPHAGAANTVAPAERKGNRNVLQGHAFTATSLVNLFCLRFAYTAYSNLRAALTAASTLANRPVPATFHLGLFRTARACTECQHLICKKFSLHILPGAPGSRSNSKLPTNLLDPKAPPTPPPLPPIPTPIHTGPLEYVPPPPPPPPPLPPIPTPVHSHPYGDIFMMSTPLRGARIILTTWNLYPATIKILAYLGLHSYPMANIRILAASANLSFQS